LVGSQVRPCLLPARASFNSSSGHGMSIAKPFLNVQGHQYSEMRLQWELLILKKEEKVVADFLFARVCLFL
jgi:hypothetical protein